MSEDDAIRATNEEATSCKLFAVSKGYWSDPYVKHFMRGGSGLSDRRAPEISRGFYARVAGVHRLLTKFLEATKCKCQVLNLGAGFDTLYWRLKDEGLAPQSFIDLDFPNVTQQKCRYIKMKKELLEKFNSEDGDVQLSTYDLHALDYHLVAADLRNMNEVEKKLKESQLDRSLPTVIIAECVLVYMDQHKSAALLKWLTETLNSCAFINYEQVNMNDRFGKVMIENLRARHCQLNGIPHCTSLDSQKDRFLSTGWHGAEAWDMSQVYLYLPQQEIQRIERLEFLDEKELLDQLFQHYCLCWAYKESEGAASLNLSQISL